MNLENIDLLKVIPENFRDDIETRCFAKAFNAIFKDATAITNKIPIYARLDNLTSLECDALAIEMHVDVYNSDWDIERKRVACKNSYLWHLHKGTVWILKDYIKSIIGSAQIKEWFEYNGLPYHFKPTVDYVNNAVESTALEELRQSILMYKNQRSIIDGFNINYKATNGTRFVGISRVKMVLLSKPLEVTEE